MNTILPVLSLLGPITMAFAFTLLVPLAVSWWIGDGALGAYLPAMGITFFSGLLTWLATAHRRRELQPRDGVLLVGLAWSLLPLFASLPLLFHFHDAGTPLSFTDAYFEAMSGLTTTGATVLAGLDALPGSINLWRCFLQWLGGMGILVLAVAILPLIGAGGSQLFRAEASGPMKDTKLTPRITETAKGLWSVYCLFSIACVAAYWAGGMELLDAWMHMFTTVSLGGLSSHDASFGYFRSPLLEWICIVFMLAASCNFALYFVALRKRSLARLGADPELRGTLALMLGASLFVAVLLGLEGVYDDPLHALRTALFNVVSIASTTGYSTVDYTRWPVFAPILMLLLSGIATSAGSTGAGIKMARLIILLKQARREMSRIVHQRAVNPVTLGDSAVSAQTIFAVLAFMLVYGATIIALTMLLLLSGMDFDTAFSAAVASVNNMGPGLGEIGPAGNFSGLSDFQTWLCTVAMLMGRLELLSFIVLFTPEFWRR
ncbi:TrkH family potassium uptake protein [Caldimonas tepidiphila]|uniref:TrkH family potassium uptake protein n=1 Tax=Caldimonas tepidiphila TaxID=2315841 RepID=UPI000E5AAAA8|nr:potassium transporter TrkG [Caldimonas tepidiphila]